MTAASSVDARTPLQRLAAAPHRAFFLSGVIAFVMLAAWWTWRIGAPAQSGVPGVLVHALFMPLGAFPLFMIGFLFTAGPRWLSQPAQRTPWPIAVGWLAGLAFSLYAFGIDARMAAIGILLMLLAWLGATLAWWRLCRTSAAPDKGHAWRILLAMTVGAIALAAGAIWAWTLNASWWAAARDIGLWGFILPVFLCVSHRMLPFFTQSALPMQKAWRPWALLDAWLIGLAAIVVGKVLGWSWLVAAAAFFLAAGFAYTSWRWGIVASLQNRLLAMLHMAFAWLAPSFLLEGLAAIGTVPVSAATHALGLGFFFTMLVGFVTRVSMGHSGRPLQADTGFWVLYLGFHITALLRVILALTPAAPTWALHAAAGAWSVLLLIWVARLVPIYLKARADGKPD